MSNEIATVDQTMALAALATEIAGLQQSSEFVDQFKQVAGSRMSFLPRLQLFTSNSELVKSGKIPLAHYGVIPDKNTLHDVGKDILVIPLAWRPKAMDVKSDPVVSFHRPGARQFNQIKQRAEADSNSGNLYGPEFLLWFPPQHGFVTFFMGSKTARNEAPMIFGLLPGKEGIMKSMLLTAQYIKTEAYSWHGPHATASAQSIEHPPQETGSMVKDFLSPKDSEIEEVTTTDEVRQDR